MNKNYKAATFVRRLGEEALKSSAVSHPYLQALQKSDFPDVDMAWRDFAFQYGLYSSQFTRYLKALISNLRNVSHQKILLSNLAEEKGHIADGELPSEVLASIEGQSHAQLFQRFQQALGVNPEDPTSLSEDLAGGLWSRRFLALCNTNEYVGVGAIGIGTELIVSNIYQQILSGLKSYDALTMQQRVFFDLHSSCDDDHAEQMLIVASELATDEEACAQIEFGVKSALDLRTAFWDALLERAQCLTTVTTPESKGISNFGY
ncbi:TenA family transcriptional regulator [Zhongshania sp. BJYM1]|uniref:TenA family transcriptional regulator n=1 Tax=Zhongshania aquatica TaxID=2965069 RepID=UPI0022B48C08|nr:iron-containing redox enzyme family protein [Marortus sp. BJYM1]